MVESVVSDLEGLKTTSGFQQLLARIEAGSKAGVLHARKSARPSR